MRDIVIEQTLPFPRDMVWAALIDSDQLAAWLMPNDFRPEVGHSFTFRTKPAPGFDGIVQSTVKVLEAPSRLVLTWTGGGIDTLVSFELEDAGIATHLRLTHSGFKGLSAIVPRLVLGTGWKSLIRKKLPALLASRGPEQTQSLKAGQ
ncbi:SRPBCC domain-containing protein [Roseinatronobacter sp. S2]|uniref:SRPBCC family protein n=1 Tax=Roseinatronobacter sp. S2 TaxID=3035471 RepID=UPI00240FDAD5|nr:SRPBCC domain-containing protein [Roseinatronobacter sp. S2]WFE74001.1 SRPBCC domain-containing protein [Roseinatronobacter sp. S2]